MPTVTYRPTGPGDLTEFASQYPASGEHWDKVDEVTADDLTTHIAYTGAGSPTDLFSISPTVLGGKITSVKVYIDATARVVTSVAWGVVKTGGTAYPHATPQVIYYSGSDEFGGAELMFEWLINPGTSSAWSGGEIYTMQFGVKVHPYVSFQPVKVTKVYMTVDYTVENIKSNVNVGESGFF